jgi:hypothetical protein
MSTMPDIKKAMDSIYSKTFHRPIRVMMNPLWAKQELDKMPFMDLKTEEYKSVYGLPIEFTSKVKTYEFVYREGEY